MSRLLSPWFTVAAAAITITAAVAQERTSPSPAEVYRVDFQLRDDTGKPRRFSMLAEAGGQNSLRIGTKVPVASALSPSGVPSQFNYMDTGINLDLRLRSAAGGKISLRLDVELTALQQGERQGAANPTIANIRTTVQAVVPVKKPTVVASIDDPATTRRLDIEVTLTQVE
ncbi:hypothetical protein F183_A32130 [Bryobacterales bacterium F-183]|nr:hypothetical protein F183_A32130 [Bryobacterales bacterium F-183]